MDVTGPLEYRTFDMNDAELIPGQSTGSGITGSAVDSFDPNDVDVIQANEKRAQMDGVDAEAVFLGQRRLRVTGTLYGESRAAFYDKLQELRSTMSPTLAYRENPAEKGYRPLYWSVPTNRTIDYPSGTIDLMAQCLPWRLAYLIERDKLGGETTDQLAMVYQVLFVMKDPTFTAQTPRFVAFTPTVNVTGDFLNRGDYHSPLNMLFEVTSAAGIITVAAGGSNFTITIPASTGNRLIRYSGSEKILTVTENSIEELRASWLDFQNATTHPLIPGGTSPYGVTFSGGVVLANSGSSMWFLEAYA